MQFKRKITDIWVCKSLNRNSRIDFRFKISETIWSKSLGLLKSPMWKPKFNLLYILPDKYLKAFTQFDSLLIQLSFKSKETSRLFFLDMFKAWNFVHSIIFCFVVTVKWQKKKLFIRSFINLIGPDINLQQYEIVLSA